MVSLKRKCVIWFVFVFFQRFSEGQFAIHGPSREAEVTADDAFFPVGLLMSGDLLF